MASLLNAAPSLFEPSAGSDVAPGRASLLNGATALAAPPTPADAWDANSKAYGDWVTKERADGVAKGLLDPETGWPTKAGLEDASRQLAQSVLMGSTAPEMRGGGWFHGTSGKFDAFNTPEVYLTDHPGQALKYAQDAHRLGGDGAGTSRVLPIEAKPGPVQNIDDHLFNAMDDGVDLGDAIDEAAAAARAGGHMRYLEYSHPNAGDQGEHTVRVSLYPQEDLAIGGQPAPPPGFTAYHGSPHSFDQFQSSAIGTGEGAQSYGHGLYFADKEGVAQSYRDALAGQVSSKPTVGGQPYDPVDPVHKAAFYVDQEGSVPAAQARVADMLDALTRQANAPNIRGDVYHASNQAIYADAASKIEAVQQVLADPGAAIPPYKVPGHMYQVRINADPAHFLDWDKPRDQLAPNVQAFAKQNYPDAWENAADGSSLYQGMVRHQQAEYVGTSKPNASQASALVSQALRDAGVPGIRYLDGGSRSDGVGTSNHVVFDPATIEILRKYGIAGLMAGGATAAAQGQSQ